MSTEQGNPLNDAIAKDVQNLHHSSSKFWDRRQWKDVSFPPPNFG